MDFILFGIQGSGKGTHGKKLCLEKDMAYFETGGALRKLASMDSELAQKIKKILEAGRLVPNEVVMEIVEDFLKNLTSGTAALFDGIPRNEEQALSLETLFKKYGREFTAVLLIIPKKVAEERLLKRRICEKCKKVFPPSYTGKTCDSCSGKLVTRPDDTKESIRTRFNIFETETMPVIERYRNEKKLIEIDGNGEISEVERNFFKSFEPYL